MFSRSAAFRVTQSTISFSSIYSVCDSGPTAQFEMCKWSIWVRVVTSLLWTQPQFCFKSIYFFFLNDNDGIKSALCVLVMVDNMVLFLEPNYQRRNFNVFPSFT